MPALSPHPAPLAGRFVRLVPLDDAELPELFRAICRPDVFAGGFGGGPAGMPAGEAAFLAWAREFFPWRSGLVYGVRVSGGALDGRLVGTTSLADLDPEREHAHIGWTAYDPAVWGTQVNAETKLLLLSLAFGHGFGRVKIQADVLNERSRAAIAGIGARFEGIVRRERRRADGSWRDTAVYSVLAEEWDAVRAGLEQRLSRYAGAPVTERARPLPASA